MTQKLFAEKKIDSKEIKFWHFFPSVGQVKMCTDSKEIYQVELTETDIESDDVYWGWKDSQDNRFCMIFPYKKSVEMCFPYGYKIEENTAEASW